MLALLALDAAMTYDRFDNVILLIKKGGAELTPNLAITEINPLKSLISNLKNNNSIADSVLRNFIRDFILPAIQNNEREDVIKAKDEIELLMADSSKQNSRPGLK